MCREKGFTRVYNQDLQAIGCHGEGLGSLETVLSGNRVVYSKQSHCGGWVYGVHRLSDHKALFTLAPPGGRRWGSGRSVAADEVTGRVAVSD